MSKPIDKFRLIEPKEAEKLLDAIETHSLLCGTKRSERAFHIRRLIFLSFSPLLSAEKLVLCFFLLVCCLDFASFGLQSLFWASFCGVVVVGWVWFC